MPKKPCKNLPNQPAKHLFKKTIRPSSFCFRLQRDTYVSHILLRIFMFVALLTITTFSLIASSWQTFVLSSNVSMCYFFITLQPIPNIHTNFCTPLSPQHLAFIVGTIITQLASNFILQQGFQYCALAQLAFINYICSSIASHHRGISMC